MSLFWPLFTLPVSLAQAAVIIVSRYASLVWHVA